MRSHAPRIMWTEAEDQVIRDLYVKGGTKAVLAVVGKTPAAIHHRACRLGILRFRRWTEKEKDQLRMDWGTMTLNELCELLGRTKEGVYTMGMDLGLTGQTPQGYELLTHASKRVGYDTKTMVSILKASSFRMRGVTTRGRQRRNRTHRHWLVDSAEVDIAVDAWLASEPLGSAARRYGIADSTMKRWLAAEGVRPPEEKAFRCHWRIPTVDIERIIGRRIRSPLENILQAGRRHGITQPTMSVWLKDAGVPIGKQPVRLDPAVVDAVVAERRKRTTCRSKGVGWKRSRKNRRKKCRKKT